MIRNSCKPRHPCCGLDPGRDSLLAHRQHRRLAAQGAGDLSLRRGQRPTLGQEVGPVDAGREISVREAEPARRAELLESLRDDEGVVSDPPAALLVDLIREPIGAEIRIRRDPEPVYLDVVGGVGDDAEAVSDNGLQPGCELAAAGPAR